MRLEFTERARLPMPLDAIYCVFLYICFISRGDGGTLGRFLRIVQYRDVDEYVRDLTYINRLEHHLFI